MFTDTVGSTALAQKDEAEALRLREEQVQIVRPLFAANRGREVKSMGDGFLVEFESALFAVRCAIEIQRRLRDRNSKPGMTPIQLRIGIHLGDVEVRGGDIFGDSVNVASRIEPLAGPWGICVTEPVFGQVRNKVTAEFESLGMTVLKDVQLPMEIYRVVVPPRAPPPAASIDGPRGLAVLPFTNISPDPKDGYFADGLTEELIIVLSQLPELRVIARTSVNAYKSTPKGVDQIGSELGVPSILEGSVRMAGNKLRIRVQLIDVATRGPVWAESYNRELDDVFAVQAEIAKQVADALKIRLGAAVEARLKSSPAIQPESYLAYLRGRTLMRTESAAALTNSKEQFELAIALDSRNAGAYAGLADVTTAIGSWHSSRPYTEWHEATRRSALRAIELDPNLAEAHTSLGLVLWDDLERSAAVNEFQRAIALNPSSSRAHSWYAGLLEELGRADEAVTHLRLAEEADPLWVQAAGQLAQLLIWLGRFDEALAEIRKVEALEPDGRSRHGLRASYFRARSELEDASRELLRRAELEAGTRFAAITRAESFALLGEKEKAKALLQGEDSQPDVGMVAHAIAGVYADLGEIDRCFYWLERGLTGRNLPFQGLRLSPRWDRARCDPRYRTLLERARLA